METRTTSLRQLATAICMPAHGKSDIYLKSIKNTVLLSKRAKENPPQLVLPAEVSRKKGQGYQPDLVSTLSISAEENLITSTHYKSGSTAEENNNAIFCIYSGDKVVPNQCRFYKPRKRKIQSNNKISVAFFLCTDTYYQQVMRKNGNQAKLLIRNRKKECICVGTKARNIKYCALTGKNQNKYELLP